MSSPGTRQRAGRKGHASCDFCKIRKLRCDRPLPCTSCKSRGRICLFKGVSGQERPISNAPCADLPPNPTLPPSRVEPIPIQTSSPCLFLGASIPQQPQADLVDDIHALKRMVQLLETRIRGQTANATEGTDASQLSPPQSTPTQGYLASPDSLGKVEDVVANLELLSRSQSSLDLHCGNELVFNVSPIQTIPGAPMYAAQLGRPTPCVWFPLQKEANTLARIYIEHLNYIQHVLHPPSMKDIIDDTYCQINGQKSVRPGHLILLFAIIACATHTWHSREDEEAVSPLFVSTVQAHAQTALWIKSAYTILHATQDSVPPALETIQGISILSFVISNLEGVSLRYRSLISTGLLMAREMGLHRVDGGSHTVASEPFRVEMGRRVWWYLVATDWLLAARYGGSCEGVYQTHPRHMTVNRPLNIDDANFGSNRMPAEAPCNQPTDMSYFLHRLRLAEISRNIVDHTSTTTTNLDGPSHYTQVMTMDFELDRMIKDMPPFFQLANYEKSSDGATAKNEFIQAYMISSLLHTQRCKLHITYLTSGSRADPAYLVSRDICLKSAEQITRAELQLLRSRHPFVLVRLRLAAILYSIFIASIILLMDVCVHRPASLQHEVNNGNLSNALGILRDARDHSLAAAKLYDSLMQIVAKYHAQRAELPEARQPNSVYPSAPSNATSHGTRPGISGVFESSVISLQVENLPSAGEQADTGLPPGAVKARSDNVPASPALEDIFTEQTSQSIVGMDEWGDLFSDVLSSSLF